MAPTGVGFLFFLFHGFAAGTSPDSGIWGEKPNLLFCLSS